MTRTNTTPNDITLGASTVLGAGRSFPLSRGGELQIHFRIDNGAGAAPSDSPVGAWQLWSSSDGTDFERVTGALVDAELAKMAPNGNNLVSGWANLESVPGTVAQLLYVRTSGGATTRVRLRVTT